jgi:hypothetical protein
MRIAATALAAVAVLGLAGALAHADPYFGGAPPQAPDACNSGFYTVNGCGCWFGPNYCLRPPFPPFNGVRLVPQQYGPGMPPALPAFRGAGGPYGAAAAGPPSFPTHPYAHSPRDFFMWGQTQND